ncbi:MAG TPA: phosphoglyceromutase, partial [Vicinamibacteria bacterium]
MRNRKQVTALVLLAAAGALAAAPPERRTANVVLVTTDGLRGQEVFGGAEERLLGKEGGVEEPEALRRAFWRETPEARREALLPFLWGVVAREGQLYGNAARGSGARVTNGLNFSYPGYNELLTGAADPRIDSNDKRPNPNVTVLEWLNGRERY